MRGIVNADDPWGRRLLERARIPMVAVSRSDASDIVLEPGRTTFTWRGQRITTPLTGAVNVDNALLAAEAALALEDLHLGPEEVALGSGHLSPVPGRLQMVAAPGEREGSGHRTRRPSPWWWTTPTRRPDSRWCSARRVSWHPGGRVLTVFGCGGNRDRAKRPLMGDVAAPA